MFPPHPLIKLSLALAGTLLPLGAQTLVYSVPAAPSPTTPSMIIAQDTEYGSAIHLAGTDRDLQSATVYVYSDVARTAEVTFSIYQAIPENRYPATGSTSLVANLQPGAALWTSGPQTITFTDDGPSNLALNQLIFSGINTLVPDNIFWAISFDKVTNLTTKFGPELGAASSVKPTGAANDPSRIYQRNPDQYNGVWVQSSLPQSNLALTIGLTAVPEPSVSALAAGFVVFGLAARRRRA